MNKLSHLLYLSILALCGNLQAMDQKPDSRKLLVIETGNNPEHTCNNFMAMAQSLGFEPTFQQSHQVDNRILDTYSTVVLNVDQHLFKTLLTSRWQPESKKPQPLVTVTQRILQGLAALTHKKIIFALPSSALAKQILNVMDKKDLFLVWKMLEDSNNIEIPQEALNPLDRFFRLSQRMDHRKHTYATTLLKAGNRATTETALELFLFEEAQKELQNAPAEHIVALPSPMPEPDALTPLWPHGVMLQGTKHNMLVTRDSHLHFADIEENFYINPLDPALRATLATRVFRMLQQFLIDGNARVVSIPRSLSPESARAAKEEMLIKRSTRTYAPTHAWLKEKPVSCAWMDVKSFKAKGPESLDAILHSGINALWLDLIPEIFLASNARCADRKEEMLTQVEWFTKNLQERAKVLGKPIPHLFMGTDITLNYKTVPVDVAAVDLYGNQMPQIPSPVNLRGFWQTQVIEVIDSFVTEWQSKIGNGLPLSGIFFDFEMYQAPEQASNFTNIMDFSDIAWQTFLDTHPISNSLYPQTLTTVAERVQYLIDTKQMDAYFTALHAEAKRIGMLVRNGIKQRLPHAIIGTYNANIPSSWWYTGFMSSLSRPEEPLVCATFNTNFFSHAKWLEERGVFLHHLQVLMLSKLRTPEDFKQIDTILENHDGVWFNRFSRLVQDMPEDKAHADHIESSPLPAEEVAERIGLHLNAQNKK